MPLLINTRQAGFLLGITDRQVRNLAKEGRIPSVRLGKLIKIPVAKLVEALQLDANEVRRTLESINVSTESTED